MGRSPPTDHRRRAAARALPPPRPSPIEGGRWWVSPYPGALDVQLGPLDLGHRRQPLRSLPDAGQQFMPTRIAELAAEALAKHVLTHLHLQPRQAKERALERRPLLLAPAVGAFEEGEVRQL